MSALPIQFADKGESEDAYAAMSPDPNLVSQLPQLQDLPAAEQQMPDLQLHRGQDQQSWAHQEADGAGATPGDVALQPHGGDAHQEAPADRC